MLTMKKQLIQLFALGLIVWQGYPDEPNKPSAYGLLRVVVRTHWGNKPESEIVVEKNFGIDAMGHDSWVEVQSNSEARMALEKALLRCLEKEKQ